MVSDIISEILTQAEAFFLQYVGQMSTLDLTIIAGYMATCLLIGIKKAGNIRNIKEFALGDRQISTAVLVSTMYATYLGAGVTIGTIETIGSMGLIFVLAVLIGPIRWLIWGRLIGSNIEQFRGCLSMGEIMYRLYGPEGRMITNIAYLMGTIATVAAQTTAIGHLLHYFLGITVLEGVLIGIGTIIFYSMMGGVKSVVMTDTLQFSVIFVMIPVLCWFMLKQFGGWEGAAPIIPAEKWTLTFDLATIGTFLSLAAYTVLDGNDNTSIQRCLMARDRKQLQMAFKIVTLIDLCMVMMVILLGLLVSTRGSAQAPDLLWETMNCHLPPLVNGMMVVCLLAVIMSTADSFLNTAGVVMAHDVFKSFVPNATNRQEVLIARIATMIVGLLAAFLAMTGSSILKLIWLSTNFYYTVVLVPIVSGFLYFRTNRQSFIASLVLAIFGTLYGASIKGSFDVISLVMGIALSAFGLFGMHYWQRYRGTLDNVAIYEKQALSNSYTKLAGQNDDGEPEDVPPSKTTVRTISAFWSMLREACQVPWKSQHDAIFSVSNDYQQFAVMGLFYCICPMVINSDYMPIMARAGADWLIALDLLLRFICVAICMFLALQYSLSSVIGKKSQSKHLYLALFYLPIVSMYSFMITPDSAVAAVGLTFTLVSVSLFVNWRACLIITLFGLACAQTLYSSIIACTCPQCFYSELIFEGSFTYILASIGLAIVLSYNNGVRMAQYDRNSKAISLTTLENNAKAKEQIDQAIHILNAVVNVPADEVAYGDHMVMVGGRQVFIISDAECAAVHDALTSGYHELERQGGGTGEHHNDSTYNHSSDCEEYSARRTLFLAIATARLSKEERDQIVVKVSRDFKFYGSSAIVQSTLHHIITHAIAYKQSKALVQILIDSPKIHITYPANAFHAAASYDVFGKNVWLSLGIDASREAIATMGGDLQCALISNDRMKLTITLPTSIGQSDFSG